MVGKKRASSASGASRPVGKKIRVGASRVKNDPDATVVDDAEQQKTLKEQFISLLSEPKNRSGISNKEIQKRFKPEEQKYTAASQWWNSWREKGATALDDQASFYLYSQKFTFSGKA